ncbi:MAG: transketolase [Parcubacteria group bacterium]|nr:transketolase [Parcubacteria group bacterium]
MNVRDLEKKANDVRKDLITMLVHAKSGHSAGPLGLADIFTALYFRILKHDPKDPLWEERDRLCLSCGHVVPVRYVAMAHAGYFPKKELLTLRKINSRLQGHPSFIDLPALEHASGPLGQGASIAVGKALAAKLKKQKHYVFCIVSDGEQQEGQTWEAAMMAGKQKLQNLIFIMDRNNIQIDGYTENIVPLEPLKAKYEAFGWHVIEIDGNNMQQIVDACTLGKTIYEKPTMIIAHTVPGKGVNFMEYDFEWHGKPPDEKQAKIALHELRTLGKKIVSEHE